MKDPDIAAHIQYIMLEGVVPENNALAKRLALEGSQYDLIDGVLHHKNPNHPGEWRIVVPVALRDVLLKRCMAEGFLVILPGKRLTVL